MIAQNLDAISNAGVEQGLVERTTEPRSELTTVSARKFQINAERFAVVGIVRDERRRKSMEMMRFSRVEMILVHVVALTLEVVLGLGLKFN